MPKLSLTRCVESPLKLISVNISTQTNIVVTINDEPASYEGSGLWTALVPFNNLTGDIVAPIVVRTIQTEGEILSETRGTVAIPAALYERRRDICGDPVEIVSGDARHKTWCIGAGWISGR